MKNAIVFLIAFLCLAVTMPLSGMAANTFNPEDPFTYLQAEFVKIENGKAYVSLTNATGKDIQSLRGGFKVNDMDGNYIDSAGFTIQNPEGKAFIKAGERQEFAPYGIAAENLAPDPHALTYKFQLYAVTFTDQTSKEFPR